MICEYMNNHLRTFDYTERLVFGKVKRVTTVRITKINYK